MLIVKRDVTPPQRPRQIGILRVKGTVNDTFALEFQRYSDASRTVYGPNCVQRKAHFIYANQGRFLEKTGRLPNKG